MMVDKDPSKGIPTFKTSQQNKGNVGIIASNSAQKDNKVQALEIADFDQSLRLPGEPQSPLPNSRRNGLVEAQSPKIDLFAQLSPKKEKAEEREKQLPADPPKKSFKEKFLKIWHHPWPSIKYENHGKKTEYDLRVFFVFHGEWKIRRWMVWFVDWKYFENFITLIILANSVMLACTDYGTRLYGEDYVSVRNLNMGVVDMAFSIIFLVECILKILSRGFCLHKNSYMRDIWSWLDLFVVIISVIGWLPGDNKNSSLKSLRTFRILRPLRSINSMPQMKALIKILGATLKGLLNVFIFLAFVFSIFAIFGTHQFCGSQYSRCRLTEAPVLMYNSTTEYEWPINLNVPWLCQTDEDCAVWTTPGQVNKCGQLVDFGIPIERDHPELQDLIWYDIINFNNVPTSLYTIFQCLTLENWTFIMYNYMDSNSIPISIFFFCFLVIFGSFFSMQLVLAQIMDSFAREQVKKQHEGLEELKEEKTNEAMINFLKAAGGNVPQDGAAIDQENSNVDKPPVQEDVKITGDIIVQDVNKTGIKQNAQSVTALQRVGKPKNLDETLRNLNKNNDDVIPFKISPKVSPRVSSIDLKLAPPIASPQVSSRVSPSPEDTKLKIVEAPVTEKVADGEVNEFLEDESDYEEETTFEKNSRLRAKKSKLLGCMYNTATNPFYNMIVFALILGNTITLTIDDFPQSIEKEQALSICNIFFTWAFTAEMLMKMVALGLQNYVKDNFNLFDCIVVVLSLLDFTISNTLTEEELALMGSGLQAIRAMRLLRVIKLARSWTKLQDILSKTVKSMKDISSFGVLLFLFLYIYALLGMEMFANKVRFNQFGAIVQDVLTATANDDILIPARLNFDGIALALTTCFCEIIGEDWPVALYNQTRAQTDTATYYVVIAYFLSLVAIGNIMLLSLFTAILLQNFEDPEPEEGAEPEEETKKEKFDIKKVFTKESLSKLHAVFLNIFGGPQQKKIDKKGLLQKEEEERLVQEQKSQNKIAEDFKSNLRKKFLRKGNVSMLHYDILDNKAAVQGPALDLEIEGRSLFIFGPENKIRIFANILYSHRYFERFILILILISTVTLAFDSPMVDPLGTQTTVLGYIDSIMSSFFYCECIIKIIALGFVMCGKKSYIRDTWNILDFTIVMSALISMIANDDSLKAIKSLRVLRVLRPLRLLNKNRGLKLAITSLFNSLPAIVNLLLIMFFFVFLIGILSMTLFAGTMFYCLTDQIPIGYRQKVAFIETQQDCYNYGGEWINKDFNFDNIGISMITLVSMQSTECWVDIMWQMVDAVNPGLQPVVNNNMIFIIFGFFVMIFLTMLFLNLFVGVVIENFNQEKEKLSLNSLLRAIEKKWIDVQIMTYSAKPILKINTTGQRFVDFMIHLSQNPKFDQFIMVMIIGNTLLLAMKWYNQSDDTVFYIEIINYIFSVIFTIEAIIKLIALKKKYFKEMWNIFDFIVVIGTWVVQIILKMDTGVDLKILGTLLRTLRIGRIFRIVKRVQAISIIFQTLIDALPAISSLGMLLGLLFFMYSIIGIGQFGSLMYFTYGGQICVHCNFETFGTAMLTLMRCATGEAWDAIMMDAARQQSINYQCNENSNYTTIQANDMQPDACGSPLVAYIYFYSFTVIVSQIFLNLFIAIIIDSFLGQSDAFSLPVTQLDIDEFREVWKEFDHDAVGYIEANKLEDFIIALCGTECNLISNRKLVIKDDAFRRRFIARLEIPAFNQFRNFLFYDVIQTMARNICEKQYNREKLANKKLAIKQEKLMAEQGVSEKMDLGVQNIFNKDYELDFDEVVNGIGELNPKIDSVIQLKQIAKKIGGQTKSHGKIDVNEDGATAEVYTSKHFVYGTLIVNCWREYVKMLEKEQQEAALAKENDVKKLS